MSTHWGYYCQDHDASTGCYLNHGEQTLTELWCLREPLAALLNAETNLGLYVVDDFEVDRTLTDFLARHHRCVLVLANEYGDRLPLLDPSL